MALETGTRLGPYEIIELCGKGGMGEVYRARDTRLDRDVAVKVLPAELSEDENYRKRLEREAKTISQLQHPHICMLLDIGSEGGTQYLVMEYLEGETLEDRLRKGPVPIDDVLRIGSEIAAAVEAAHAEGVVHRDLKPGNVMLTNTGTKVLDFGLAKGSEVGGVDPDAKTETVAQALTVEGTLVGTLPYMSPEQLRGETLDSRSDLFSFGVMLYELLTAVHPFRKETQVDTSSAILGERPAALADRLLEVPDGLQALIDGLLETDREDRLGSAAQVERTLHEIVARMVPGRSGAEGRRPRRSIVIAIAIAVVVLVAGALYLPYRARRSAERARALIPEIERLAAGARYGEAYELAIQVEEQLPQDPALVEWMPQISDSLTVTTDPEGASVYLQRFAREPATASERVLVGTTPVTDHRIARVDHRLWVEKAGFETLERIASSTLNRAEARMGFGPAIVFAEVLQPAGSVPDGMVWVPGGEYRLRGAGVGGLGTITLDDYFIDKFEVSNEQYQGFIRAGGYSNPPYWDQALVREGVELEFDKAMRPFTDRSGLPGPREWSNQEYPKGRGNYPVTGVSWYEATAYAEYAGKALPTIYQWEKAARAGRFTRFEGIVMPWGQMGVSGTPSTLPANFYGRDVEPVDSYPFGISPYGAYNMAGNVAEWCFNERGLGRATAGASWPDAHYRFSWGSSRPAFEAENSIGFRCVSKPAVGAADQGTDRIEPERTALELTPVDEDTFQGFLSHYRYDEKRGTAELVETVETPDWTREKLIFAGTGNERIIAYLYLPKHARPPYQCINWVPSGTVLLGRTVAQEVEAILAPQIKAGRAVMAVVPKYALERGDPPLPPPDQRTPVWVRTFTLRYVAEFRMGLDYLESREEIDMTRVSHIGFSWGAEREALILIAVEPRIRSAILIAAELDHGNSLPEVNVVNFVPRIKVPVLVMNGRYDEEIPYEPNGRLLFELLPEPKRLELVDSGHLPPIEVRSPIINEFLDETLGPVAR